MCSIPRNGGIHRNNRAATAVMHREIPHDSVACKRRGLLFLGVSFIPLLEVKAFEGFVTEGPEIKVVQQEHKAEKILQGDAAPNFFLSFLSGLGICSAAALGILSAVIWNEKIAAETILESMKNKLNEKERTIALLEKKFESRLLNEEEERSTELKRANEECNSLTNQLHLANSTIADLDQGLQKEKILVKDLNGQIQNLQSHLMKVREGKKELEEKLKENLSLMEDLQERATLLGSEIKTKDDSLHDLNCMLAAKELEIKKLNSAYEQVKEELVGANSEIRRLKLELLKNQKELELKINVVDDVDVQVRSLIVQSDDCKNKFDFIQKEYNDLRSSSIEEAAADAKLWGDTDHELHQLRERIDIILSEMSRKQVLVADLSEERDGMRKMLDRELSDIKNLRNELQRIQETLVNSRNEACDLAEQLQHSRSLCSDLEGEVSRIQSEFAETKELFQVSLEEEKQGAEVLSAELASTNPALKNAEDELQIVSLELAAVIENYNGLQKELVDAYRMAESGVHDLEEENRVIASFNNKLQALDKHILKETELQKSVIIDLDEAKKSLDEMNRNALTLSKDLEMTKSQISILEEEREMLDKSIAEQKQASQEARESIEHVHNIVMKLGKERERMEERAKKLEDELASAKGEILRLQSEINSSRALVKD